MLPALKRTMRKRSGQSLRFYLKLMRHPGSPERVGRGVAAGLFTAFVIPLGHMLAAFPLAMLVRGTKSAAMLATWIINPFTIPVVYPFQCWLGAHLLRRLGLGEPLSYALFKEQIAEFFRHPGLRAAGELGGELIASFFAGGLLLGTLAAAAGYPAATALVRRFHARKARRKEQRAQALNPKEITP